MWSSLLCELKWGGELYLCCCTNLSSLQATEKKTAGHILPLLIQWLEGDWDEDCLISPASQNTTAVTALLLAQGCGFWCTYTSCQLAMESLAAMQLSWSPWHTVCCLQVSPGWAHMPPSVAKATSFPCLHERHLAGDGRAQALPWWCRRQRLERRRWQSRARVRKGVHGTIWEERML